MNDYPSAPQRTGPPPLSATLYEASQTGRSGILTVTNAQGESSHVAVRRGRVVRVEHRNTTPTAVLDLLRRTGLLDDAAVEVAQRFSQKRGEPLDEAVVSANLVTAGTLTRIREMLHSETVLELMLDRDVLIDEDWIAGHGPTGKESCSLPIPFLLKEAMRRNSEFGPIRRRVPSPEAVFVRTADVRQERETWEGLTLGPAERQVYFFLDGRRTVADLGSITCQSNFSVARSLAAMVESGHIQQRPSEGSTPRLARGRRSAILRIGAMSVATAALIGLVLSLAGTASSSWSRAATEAAIRNPFRTLADAASQDRLVGAIRLYDLMYRERPGSFQDLLDEGLVAPSDVRAAATFAIDGEFLLQADPVAPASTRKPQEANVQDGR